MTSLRVVAALTIALLLAACGVAYEETPAEPIASPAAEPPRPAASVTPDYISTWLPTQDVLDRQYEWWRALPSPLRSRVIVLDPGHGGPEIGAVHHAPDGTPDLVEKESNLDMAFRLRAILEARGYRVILTRETNARADPSADDLPGYRATRADLQARVDIANNAAADLFISIHSNGSHDPALSGVEVWYSASRTFGNDNERLARLVHERVLTVLREEYGYPAADRGVRDDAHFRVIGGRSFHIFVLGPEREYRVSDLLALEIDPSLWGIDVSRLNPDEDPVLQASRATQMPGVLVELLFLTNDADAAVLKDEAARDVMASALADAIDTYFAVTP